MENKNPAVEVVIYGRAIASFLRHYDTLHAKAGWFERGLLWLLQTTYWQRLRAFVEMLPPEISNQIFDVAESNINSDET